MSVTNEQACARRKGLARVTRSIFLKFSDQKDDAKRSFYLLNVPKTSLKIQNRASKRLTG
ncbi:MAG: Unknown protein [uncultured Aureispira sp.]|uniref:Uncharacterized protein n=1 Tax=uncultured Aureispira sp. TaxID=1331704 RepID=A0A6S6TBN2_9BACT|nr:MAG: Unknown protein [uncultured Aureispira sp.]